MKATIQDLINEARQYCALIEGSQAQKNSWALANECLRSVFRLYSAALALPETDPGNNDALVIGIGHSDWQAMRTSVAVKGSLKAANVRAISADAGGLLSPYLADTFRIPDHSPTTAVECMLQWPVAERR